MAAQHDLIFLHEQNADVKKMFCVLIKGLIYVN